MTTGAPTPALLRDGDTEALPNAMSDTVFPDAAAPVRSKSYDVPGVSPVTRKAAENVRGNAAEESLIMTCGASSGVTVPCAHSPTENAWLLPLHSITPD